MRVTVIDYKAGNLTSVLKALHHLGAETVVTDGDLTLVETAERLVLPGVGHFAATERLDTTGLTPAIRAAIAHGIPYLRRDAVAFCRLERSASAARTRALCRIVHAFCRKQGESATCRLELARCALWIALACWH